MSILGIKPEARVSALFDGVAVPGTLVSVANGGAMGAVRVDSTGRNHWLSADEIVPRWPWTQYEREPKAPAPQSGYTPCACRDCMDIAVSSDWTKPELCSECTDAGCEIFPRGFNNSSVVWECQRDDAYGSGR